MPPEALALASPAPPAPPPPPIDCESMPSPLSPVVKMKPLLVRSLVPPRPGMPPDPPKAKEALSA